MYQAGIGEIFFRIQIPGVLTLAEAVVIRHRETHFQMMEVVEAVVAHHQLIHLIPKHQIVLVSLVELLLQIVLVPLANALAAQAEIFLVQYLKNLVAQVQQLIPLLSIICLLIAAGLNG